MKEDQGRYVSIPMDVFGRVENVVDAVIYGYIAGWENSTKKAKVALHAGRERIATDLKIEAKTVTRSLQRLEKIGLVAYKRYPRGIWVTTRTDVIRAWQQAKVIGQNVPSQSQVIGQNVLSTGWDKKSYHEGQNVLSNNITPLPSEGIITPVATYGGGGGPEPFETVSDAILPASNPKTIPDALKGLASQAGPIAERWIYAHIASGTAADDWRLLAVLREAAAMTSTIRSPKILELKFNDLPEQKPAPAKPERITTKDGKRVKVNGEWLEAATPYPNQPPLKPTGVPMAGLFQPMAAVLPPKVVKAQEEAKAAKQKEVNEQHAKREAERARSYQLSERRKKRTNELLAQGKSLMQAADICRTEGLMAETLDR